MPCRRKRVRESAGGKKRSEEGKRNRVRKTKREKRNGNGRLL